MLDGQNFNMTSLVYIAHDVTLYHLLSTPNILAVYIVVIQFANKKIILKLDWLKLRPPVMLFILSMCSPAHLWISILHLGIELFENTTFEKRNALTVINENGANGENRTHSSL